MIYTEITVTLNRIQREFASNIVSHLHNNGIYDVSAWQALVIMNIGDRKHIISRLKEDGYYTGLNLTYNLKELQKAGYIIKEKSIQDERATYVSLTDQGMKILGITECVLLSHNKSLNDIGITEKDMYSLNGMLKVFEKILLNR